MVISAVIYSREKRGCSMTNTVVCVLYLIFTKTGTCIGARTWHRLMIHLYFICIRFAARSLLTVKLKKEGGRVEESMGVEISCTCHNRSYLKGTTWHFAKDKTRLPAYIFWHVYVTCVIVGAATYDVFVFKIWPANYKCASSVALWIKLRSPRNIARNLSRGRLGQSLSLEIFQAP